MALRIAIGPLAALTLWLAALPAVAQPNAFRVLFLKLSNEIRLETDLTLVRE